jgi:hypothetical protein
MKIAIHKPFLMILFAFSLVAVASPSMAQVYKTVDEDGNVSYTDQPPADGSKPIELAPISVIEAPIYEKAPVESGAEDGVEEVPLRTLRRNFRDFAIISPQPEESVWQPDGPIPIAWSAGSALLEGMQVTISIDGQRKATTTQSMVPVVGMERGEHTVTAELRDSKNRTIATAKPVTFFVRQPNLYSNPRVNINPRGGG